MVVHQDLVMDDATNDAMLVDNIGHTSYAKPVNSCNVEDARQVVVWIGGERKSETMLLGKLHMALPGVRAHAKDHCPKGSDLIRIVSKAARLFCASWSEILWVEVQDEMMLADNVLKAEQFAGVEDGCE